MGWSIGYDSNWDRDIGYGVPAVCDHPDCNKEINRGIGYVCGSDAHGGERGCGLECAVRHDVEKNMERGTGRTTKQMKEAKQGAVFVWVNGQTDYPKRLARSLGRDDIKIVGPQWLSSGQHMGLRLSELIVDHAAMLSQNQLHHLQMVCMAVVHNNELSRNEVVGLECRVRGER